MLKRKIWAGEGGGGAPQAILPQAQPRSQGPLPLNPKKAPWGRDFPEPGEALRYTHS